MCNLRPCNSLQVPAREATLRAEAAVRAEIPTLFSAHPEQLPARMAALCNRLVSGLSSAQRDDALRMLVTTLRRQQVAPSLAVCGLLFSSTPQMLPQVGRVCRDRWPTRRSRQRQSAS